MARRKISLPLNLATMQDEFTASIQALASHVANALSVKPQLVRFHETPNARMTLEYCDVAEPTPELLTQSYQSFILRSAFQELVDSTIRHLEAVRHACAVLRLLALQRRDGEFPSEVYNKEVVEERRKFHWLRLPRKLTALTQEYGLVLPPTFQEQTISITDVRNCMVHAAGLVTPGFVSSSGALELRWQYLQIVHVQEGLEREVGPGDIVDKGFLHLRVGMRAKSFSQGTVVQLSAAEFVELAFGVVMGAVDLRKALHRRGIEIGAFPGETAT